MPIQIRELIIKAAIEDVDTGQDTGAGSGVRSADKEEIVADCVQQVMELLRRRSER
jgi:hypothetical protein